MRAGFVLIVILGISSCNQTPNLLEGSWSVSSDFYKANYRITKQGRMHHALILMYDDGTTRFKHDPLNPNYLFKSLRSRNDGIYVDAISGATKSKNTQANFRISQINIDTLFVDQYIKGKPISEVWVRMKN